MGPTLTELHWAGVCMLACLLLSLFPQVERFGKPTWRKLVEAMKNPVGGYNCALAQKIAEEHPGMPSNSVH